MSPTLCSSAPSSAHPHHLLLPRWVAVVTKAGGRGLADPHTKACRSQRAACRGMKPSVLSPFFCPCRAGSRRHPMPGALRLIKLISDLILLTNQDNCSVIKLASCMEMPA